MFQLPVLVAVIMPYEQMLRTQRPTRTASSLKSLCGEIVWASTIISLRERVEIVFSLCRLTIQIREFFEHNPEMYVFAFFREFEYYIDCFTAKLMQDIMVLQLADIPISLSVFAIAREEEITYTWNYAKFVCKRVL